MRASKLSKTLTDSSTPFVPEFSYEERRPESIQEDEPDVERKFMRPVRSNRLSSKLLSSFVPTLFNQSPNQPYSNNSLVSLLSTVDSQPVHWIAYMQQLETNVFGNELESFMTIVKWLYCHYLMTVHVSLSNVMAACYVYPTVRIQYCFEINDLVVLFARGPLVVLDPSKVSQKAPFRCKHYNDLKREIIDLYKDCIALYSNPLVSQFANKESLDMFLFGQCDVVRKQDITPLPNTMYLNVLGDMHMRFALLYAVFTGCKLAIIADALEGKPHNVLNLYTLESVLLLKDSHMTEVDIFYDKLKNSKSRCAGILLNKLPQQQQQEAARAFSFFQTESPCNIQSIVKYAGLFGIPAHMDVFAFLQNQVALLEQAEAAQKEKNRQLRLEDRLESATNGTK